MRRTGSAVAALLGVTLLASCALTPPVLGGRPTAGPTPGEYTDEDVAALLIVDDPGAENVVRDVADYRTGVGEEAAASCPGAALLLPDDTALGSIVVSPPLFLDLPGADLLVAQVARRFDTTADADAFVASLRVARAECPELEIVDGDFAGEASGFASDDWFEWVLVDANLAISLTADARETRMRPPCTTSPPSTPRS